MKLVSLSAAIDRHQQERAASATTQVLGGTNALNEALFKQMDQAVEELKSLDVMKAKFSKFALVGIGGSSLGVQVFSQFFANTQFTYFDNVDAAEFESQIKQLGNLKDVMWIFTSKSGETIETLAVLEFVDQLYTESKLDLGQHCVVITEKKSSALSQWANERKTLQFEVPLAVGGRYSVLSHVGLVPAYLMGLDIKALALGARKALESKELIQTFVGASLSSFERQEWMTILWSYSSRLKSFGLWWQQLWAESLAKKVDLVGKPALRVSTPLSLVGATDQHSVLQQVNEGHKDKLVIFLRVQAAEVGSVILKKAHLPATQVLQGLRLGDLLHAEALATQQSLSEEGVSNLVLQVGDLNEETLGYLFMFMQMTVLILGKALNLNPQNQPGVERGKVLCKKILTESRADLGEIEEVKI